MNAPTRICGWDQGLLFLNPAQVWLQPPGYVTRMVSRSYQPVYVPTVIAGTGHSLNATASRSEDGRTLVLRVVNLAAAPVSARLKLEGLAPANPTIDVEELAGPLDTVNTATDPNRLVPRQHQWKAEFTEGQTMASFPPYSFSVLRME